MTKSNSVANRQVSELLARGFSYKQIAETMGVTKSAVAGRIARLQSLGMAPRGGGNGRAIAAPPLRRPQLGDLRLDQCRWPTGDPRKDDDFGFCGETTSPHKPFCPVHCERAYHRGGPSHVR